MMSQSPRASFRETQYGPAFHSLFDLGMLSYQEEFAPGNARLNGTNVQKNELIRF